ncbi:MAG: efflux transporter periplasmic adaptor subunit, partial [Rhodoferax sp.]|nr:efflux transporter periplasmic adaptor subunit [Rhodoferax sp.]
MTTRSFRLTYSVVAVATIALAAALAWWVQSGPAGPREVSAAAGGSKAGAASASGPRVAGVEVAQVATQALSDDAQAV